MNHIHTDVLTLALAAQRRAFVTHIEAAVARVEGAALGRLSWRKKNGEHSDKSGSDTCALDFTVPGKLSCTLFVSPGSVPIIHWYGAESHLRAVYGAWAPQEINQFHGCKATSYPVTLNRMIDALVKGLMAAADGSAFK